MKIFKTWRFLKLFFRGKSEHKISVWWSSYWASMTPFRDCPRRRATNLVQGGWHAKFPANPPWRKSRMKIRRSARRTKLLSLPISNCGNTPSLTNQARDRSPRSSPNKQILLPDQQLPQPTMVVFFYPNWCKRTPFLDKSVWRKFTLNLENRLHRTCVYHRFLCLSFLSSPFIDESWVS